MASNISNRRKRDIGWEHGTMIDNNRLWTKCNHCEKEMKGSGVSRLKQHIAGGFPNVEKCTKCPVAVSRAMRDHLDSKKEENAQVMAEKASLRDTLMEPIRRKHGLVNDFVNSDDSDDELFPEERERLNIAMQRSMEDGQENELGRSYHGASSSRHGKQKNKYFVRKDDTAFKTKTNSFGRKITGLRIEEMDPSLYRNRAFTQQRLPSMLQNNPACKAAKHAIGKWFIFSNIPPNAASNIYYQAAIDAIVKAGNGVMRDGGVTGVTGPTPYEITGPILDAEIEEIQDYISSFKKKWETYGVTIMCDGWSSTTKLSIINFLIYCDGKIVFHKSVNASSQDKDANYIYELMDDVVEEIGEKYVVQVITDNGSNYKKAGELLMRKRKHLYWTPCAAHCIDLVLEDFAEKTTVKVVIENAKRISNFIYNHGKVLAIMRKFTNGRELIRPGITRFATNYISVESILKQKANPNLQRMFTSEEWSKNSASKDPSEKKIQDIILSPTFWGSADLVCNLHAPVSRVLRVMDGEKQATMGYLFEGMRRSKLAIEAALTRSHKKYCDIIDRRIKDQMIRDIHLAAYYLNPAYHYDLELSNKQELLDALKKVIQKIEPDENAATLALSEGKYFREAMYGFVDSRAIRGRKTTDPAEWWFMYGIDAPNLRKVALRILSQTTSSSGCERNWSTFALIHTKVRNRLNYEKLERLVYAHYNMRLRLRHLMKDKRKVDREFQPIDLSHIFDDEILSEWLDDPGDALLDEYDDDGQPTRPNTFLATWSERFGVPSKRGEGLNKDAEKPSNVEDESEFDLFRSEKRAKGSAVGDDHDVYDVEEDSDSDDVRCLSLSKNGDKNKDGGSSSKENHFQASQQGIFFTEEQFFDHATQDENHGSRRSKC